MAGDLRWRRGMGWGALVVVAALGFGSVAGAGSAGPIARAARTIHMNETARLHLVRKSGAILKERGTATGTLPGSVSARFDTSNAAKVTGSVTFYPRSGGSLTATVVGYPQSLGTVAKVNGYLAIRRGTGRYARALGNGSFTGTVNRRTWAITVHAKAKLTY